MKIGYKILSMVAVMALVMSCDLSKDLDNPNEVGASEANPDLLMNKIQTDFGLFFNKVAGVSDRNESELSEDVKAMTKPKHLQWYIPPRAKRGLARCLSENPDKH